MLLSTLASSIRLDALDNPKIAGQYSLQSHSSLQEIIAEVYEDGPSDYIRRKMESRGWTFITTEYVEEGDWGRRLSQFDYDNYCHGKHWQ